MAELQTNDILNFPKLTVAELNPTAIQLCGGTHALSKCDTCITYIRQQHLKSLNLNREQMIQYCRQFPGHMIIEYFRMNTRPQDWDDAMFGPFVPVTLIRTAIPPSNKSATTRSNYHFPVIAYADQGSSRLGLRPPYDRILYFYCCSCPSLNGSLSFDKHLAALLKAVSFCHHFRSTARVSDFLNTVSGDARQVRHALPTNMSSADMPVVVPRRSRDTRARDPLYPGFTGII